MTDTPPALPDDELRETLDLLSTVMRHTMQLEAAQHDDNGSPCWIMTHCGSP